MGSEQTITELTTRDVFLQVDRRLTLIEGDLRGLDDKTEALDMRLSTRIEALDTRLSTRIDTLEVRLGDKIEALDLRLSARIDDKIDALDLRMDDKIEGLRSEMTTQLSANLKWTLGTMIALAGLVVAVFKL